MAKQPPGLIPQKPFDNSRSTSVRQAIDKEGMLDVLRNTTEPSYHRPFFDDPRGTIAAHRSIAKIASLATTSAYRSQQASFFLPYPFQGDQSATSVRSATMTLDIRMAEDSNEGRIAEIGAIQLTGPGGRTYINSIQIEWLPYEIGQVKSVPFISENPGWPGNLNCMDDGQGNIVRPDGTPDTDIIDFADQGGRSGDNAVTVKPFGSPVRIIDDGGANRFSQEDVGLYLRIISGTDDVNVGRLMKVIGFEQPGLEDPVGSGRFPNKLILEDEEVRGRIFSFQAEDGGAFTDETAEAQNSTVDDMTLLPAVVAVNDAANFGSKTPFSAIEIEVSTAGVGDWVIVWEYEDLVTSWTALTLLDDPSAGFTIAGIHKVSFQRPADSDWATPSINGLVGFYIRARVTSVTTTTTPPLGARAYTFDHLEISDNGNQSWQIVDWKEMGFIIDNIGVPEGGADDMLRILGDERGVSQQADESDSDFSRRASQLTDVVSPQAIQRAINRHLRPFDLKGLAIDVSNGLDGFFLDSDALDHTGVPDFTEFKVLLSLDHAYGHFCVFLPYIPFDTDYQFHWDSVEVETPSAWGIPFWDGVPPEVDGAYRAIYDEVDRIRLGGVSFVMIRDASLNDDPCVPE